MARLAIKGHTTRGKEVIQLLEMLGGVNAFNLEGAETNSIYYIDKDKNKIYHCLGANVENVIVFTLEEFEEKYPYKVGDKVYNIVHNENQTITDLAWDFQENEVVYQTSDNEYVYVNYLQPYKEETMEERDEKAANHVFETEVISFDIAQRDKYELDLQGKFEVVLREGKYYVERIKPKYPEAFEECAKILDCFSASYIDEYKNELLEKACKWLEENYYNVYQGTWQEIKEQFINDFKKAMEE